MRVFRAVDLLSNSEHLLLKDYTTGLSMVDKKRHNDIESKMLWVVSSRQCHA